MKKQKGIKHLLINGEPACDLGFICVFPKNAEKDMKHEILLILWKNKEAQITIVEGYCSHFLERWEGKHGATDPVS